MAADPDDEGAGGGEAGKLTNLKGGGGLRGA